MKTNVVVISGTQGSGKTSLANALLKRSTSGEAVKFADPLYEIHDLAVGIVRNAGIKFEKKKDGELLQYLGTEWGRKINVDIWAKIAKATVDYIIKNVQPTDLIVIDDCRFENEFDIFKDMALMVRLECPEEIRKVRAEYWRENTNHPSETGLNLYAADMKFDEYFATNILSTEEIADKIMNILKTPAWELKYGKKI